jgi:hypothetical protein
LVLCLAKKVLLPKKVNLCIILEVGLFQTVLQYFFFYGGLAHASGVKSSIIESCNVFLQLFCLLSSCIMKTSLAGNCCTVCRVYRCLLINLNGQTMTFDMAWNGEGFIFLSTIAACFCNGTDEEVFSK